MPDEENPYLFRVEWDRECRCKDGPVICGSWCQLSKGGRCNLYFDIKKVNQRVRPGPNCPGPGEYTIRFDKMEGGYSE